MNRHLSSQELSHSHFRFPPKPAEQGSLFEYQEQKDAVEAVRSGVVEKAAKWEEVKTTWLRLIEAGWDQEDIADALYDLVEELALPSQSTKTK